MAIKVSVDSCRGHLRLRWTYQGKRAFLSMGMKDTPLARTIAQSKANIIEGDLMTGNYDPTLKKYKSVVDVEEKCKLTTVGLFDRFVKQRRVDAGTLEKYSAIGSRLKQYFGEKPADMDLKTADAFREWLAETLAPISQKEYIGTIKSCFEWALKEKLLKSHPWKEVFKAVKVPPKQRPRPFTKVEILAILDGFRASDYYAHYGDFVSFLFGTGCRTGEAIGLRWSHLPEDCSKVWIGESISRGVRKATKTNRSREFRLTPQLQAMLLKRRPEDYRPDDLVFPSPKGLALETHNFRNRAWKTILKTAGVEYRKPYNTRHTFISHALTQNQNPMTIAQMTGHDPEILFKHYAADISGGLQCPDIGIF